MISPIEQFLASLHVTRLAHFTPSLNLAHIVNDGKIRSSKDLAENSPDYFSPTDFERFDRSPHMVCCSFQYPNPYYLAKAIRKPQFVNYPDWVCLLLDASLMYDRPAKVSPYNAATANGRYLRNAGVDSIRSCFAPQVGDWKRGPSHRAGVPTDVQAEVQVAGPIDLSFVRGIVVANEGAALNEWGRLQTLGHNPSDFSWAISPIFFNKYALSGRLRFGGDIPEEPWTPSNGG